MASYDLKAILGEKLKRLTDKTLKALVDCMCTVGASLCSLDKRVSALESVELPEGGYKPMQEPVSSPSASGTAIQFIESVSQDATGRMTATKKTVRDGTTSQKGVVQLEDSYSSTSTTKAATPNSVKSAYDLASGKYSKPSGGIPKTDLASDVQTSLGKADSALQSGDVAHTYTYNSEAPISGKGVTEKYLLKASSLTSSDDIDNLNGKMPVTVCGTRYLFQGPSTVGGTFPGTKKSFQLSVLIQHEYFKYMTQELWYTDGYEEYHWVRKCVNGTWQAWKIHWDEPTSTYSSSGSQPVNGQAVESAISGKEDNSNKVSSWQGTPDNTHYPSEKLVKDGLDAKVDIANIDLDGKTTTILAEVQALATKGIHYARFYTRGDSGAVNISDKPVSGSGFLCEVLCNRFAGPTNYRYIVTCWAGEDKNPYWTYVKSDTASITWSRLNAYVPGTPTNNNLVAMDASGLVKDSGVAVLPSTSTWDETSDAKVPTAKAVQAKLDAISTAAGAEAEVTAAALDDLDARMQSVENAVNSDNIGDKIADSLDAQSLKVGGQDVVANIEYVAAQSGGGGDLMKTVAGTQTSVLRFMNDTEAVAIWNDAKQAAASVS